MGRASSTYVEEKRRIQSFVGQPEGSRLLGSPRQKWEDNIKINIRELEWEAYNGSIWLRIGTSGGLL
jgi:hypothetical protein